MKKLYVLLLLVFVVASCKKDKTSWNSDYSIPLINDSLSLDNFVNDSTLQADNFGYYQMNLKRQLFRFDLNSEIGIPDTSIISNFSSPISTSVPPGFEFVNEAQEKDFNLSDLELTKIFLKKGQIEVKVSNPYPTDVICTIVLPGTTLDGQVITDQLTVGPGSINNPTIASKTIDIAYSIMDLKGLSGNSFNKLSYQITVKSDPSGPAVNTSSAHVTKIETKVKNVELMYAKGYFGNRIITETVETDIEVLKNWVSGTIDLQSIHLNLALSNSIKAMARIKIIEVTTTKFDGTTTSLTSNQINVAQNVNSATGSWSTLVPSVTNFTFNGTNSNIEEFIENAGSKVKVVYEFELNPLGNITSSNNEIFPESSAILDLSLEMPLSIGMSDFNLRDTLDLNLSKNEAQLDRAQAATIQAYIENGFPIDGHITLFILDENNVVLHTIDNSNFITSGSYGLPNIQGVNTKLSELNWILTKEDIQKIKTGKRLVIDGVFNTPNPNGTGNSPMLIQENSFLKTRLQLNLTFQNEI